MYQDLNKSHQKKILWRIPFFFFFFYLQDKKGSKTLYLLHLLLHNKIPLKLNSQSNKHVTLHRVSWVLGIRKGLAGWFWPTVSHKVTVKTLAWAAVMWRLDWGWRICFQDSTPRWLLGRRPLLLAQVSPEDCWWHGFPQSKWFKKERD